MERNDEPLRIVLSLKLNRDDSEWDDGAVTGLQAAVSFSYCGDGVHCDGEINLRFSFDD